MLGHQFAYSAAPVRKVKEVQFGILSPEEIVREIYFIFFYYFLNMTALGLVESIFCGENRASRSYG
jgi:hypothetical protein